MEFQASHPSSDSFAPRLAPISHEAQLRDHRSLLHRLYVTENKTMKAVMDHMETHFKLRVGLSTYTRIFREMNIRKNAKGNHWAYVDDRIRKRQSQGKASQVYAQGRLVEQNKVKKEIARHVTTRQQIASATGPCPESPDGWSVETPGNESDAVKESLEDEAMMIGDDGTTTIPDARSNATAPPDTNQPVNRTEGVSLLNLQLQASRDPYHRSLGSTHGMMSMKTTMGTPEDETMMIPSDRTTTMLAKPTAETVTGNVTAQPDASHTGYETVRIQLQASRDFYDALPEPSEYDRSAIKLQLQTFWISYDAHRAPTHEAPLDYQVGYLAERLQACKAFRTLSFLGQFHDWNCVYYRIIARNIVSVLHRQVLGPCFSSHRSFGEAIQITVCTMKNDPDLLRATFTSANDTLLRDELDDVLNTALYLATEYDLVDAARTLIVLGADPNVRDFYGKTCRDVARDRNHGEIVALLGHHDAAEGARRALPTGVAGNEAIDPEFKMELGTDIKEPGRAVNIPKKDSAGSGPYGFHKWYDSVVMPWAQRNWDSFGSSFSMGSFRVKLHSRPTSK